MRILSIIRDKRINATSVLTEMSTQEYLHRASNAVRNLDIQRGFVKGFKPYDLLRNDIKMGCVIPPLVIGIRSGVINPPNGVDDSSFLDDLFSVQDEDVFIIDGLQRTNALMKAAADSSEDELADLNDQSLRVEVWPDITMSALTYRMILLNAGQKPMSLKHQLEVVSTPLCREITTRYGGKIQIYKEMDTSRRSAPGQYQFSVIASSFQAFLQCKPHINIRNEVMSEINQLDVLTSYGESISNRNNNGLNEAFIDYMGFLVNFDSLLCAKYPMKQRQEGCDAVPSGVTLLSSEAFHLGLAAAYGWCYKYKLEVRDSAITKLIALVQDEQHDPLALATYTRLQSGFTRKDSAGEQARTLAFGGFKEFFRSGGDTPFHECWLDSTR